MTPRRMRRRTSLSTAQRRGLSAESSPADPRTGKSSANGATLFRLACSAWWKKTRRDRDVGQRGGYAYRAEPPHAPRERAVEEPAGPSTATGRERVFSVQVYLGESSSAISAAPVGRWRNSLGSGRQASARRRSRAAGRISLSRRMACQRPSIFGIHAAPAENDSY